ncbi:MAG: hypothetical protein Q8R37_02395, partial [Nanoarchaeota archaeon]|nr:hypothetical protein [Nanoarchaeota archaeon]
MTETMEEKVGFWYDKRVATKEKVIDSVTLGIAGYGIGLLLGTVYHNSDHLPEATIIPFTLGITSANGRFLERMMCGGSGAIGYQAGLL